MVLRMSVQRVSEFQCYCGLMRESVDTNGHPTSRRPGPPIPTQHNHNSMICNPTQSPSPAAPQRPTDPAHPGQPKTTTTQLLAIPYNPLHQSPTTHWIPKKSELQSYILGLPSFVYGLRSYGREVFERSMGFGRATPKSHPSYKHMEHSYWRCEHVLPSPETNFDNLRST